VPAILDVYEIPYTFADPATMAVCLHKGWTKTVVRQAGVPTPDWQVAERLSDLEPSSIRFPVIVKPVAEGTGKGIDASSKVDGIAELRSVASRLLERFRQPVLVERFLPGREFTVGLLGGGETAEVIGMMEIKLLANAERDVYSYTNKEMCEERVAYDFIQGIDDQAAAQAAEIALAAWRAVGGCDAGRVDLRCDAAGRPQMIEINPLAGLHPTHSDLPAIWSAFGGEYRELIHRIVESARARNAHHKRHASAS
jgi:D-alanine-D-alanine ligase